MKEEFRLLDTNQKNYCLLREHFDGLNGESRKKKIDLRNIRNVTDMEERPEYTSILNIFKSKGLRENRYYIFFENVYTNDPFLRRFEGFLRASAEDVEAQGFEDIPKEYKKDWYDTPFTSVPVDTYEVGAVLHEPGKKPKLIHHREIFRGVDYKRKSTLRMVRAQTIDEKLKEIEAKSNFSAVIEYLTKSWKPGQEKLEAIEIKHGLVHFALTRM